jgi:hypothetical protein
MAKKGRKGLRPGQKVPLSGQYRNSKTRSEVTSVKGERVPPGPKGSSYVLADRTKHKSRK